MKSGMSPQNTVARIAPSLICLDLCNLERDVRQLEDHGLERLHVDILDGRFSPSMPIGLDVVRQLRAKTQLAFDVHLMVMNNEFFIRELLAIGVQRLCFHCESALHVDRMLGLIRESAVEAGIALTPATPPAVLECVLERLDFVLLMLINPGFAGHKDEKQVPYAVRKVADGRRFLDERGRDIPILIDGRVSFETIPALVAAGADILTAGTSCLFAAGNSFTGNLVRTQEAIEEGLRRRKVADR